MPIKEFACTACGHKFEEILGINEPNPEVCPKCGKKELKRVLGTFKIAGARSKSAPPADEGGEGLDSGLEGAGGFGAGGGMDEDMDLGAGDELGDEGAGGPEAGDFPDEED